MVIDDCSKTKARKAAYRWLSKQLGISAKICHIGMFDVETCKRVVEICESVPKISACLHKNKQMAEEWGK